MPLFGPFWKYQAEIWPRICPFLLGLFWVTRQHCAHRCTNIDTDLKFALLRFQINSQIRVPNYKTLMKSLYRNLTAIELLHFISPFGEKSGSSTSADYLLAELSYKLTLFSLCGRTFGHLATSKGGAAHRTLLLQSYAVRGHLAGADGRVHPPEPQSLSGGRPGQGSFRQTGTHIQAGLRIRIRIGSRFNRVSGSGSVFGIRIRIQEGKNDSQKLKKI
jgi:hypothetical protein